MNKLRDLNDKRKLLNLTTKCCLASLKQCVSKQMRKKVNEYSTFCNTIEDIKHLSFRCINDVYTCI